MKQTGSAVAQHCFPSRRHRKDKMNIQKLILKMIRILQRKIVDGSPDGRIQANVGGKKRDCLVYESFSKMKA